MSSESPRSSGVVPEYFGQQSGQGENAAEHDIFSEEFYDPFGSEDFFEDYESYEVFEEADPVAIERRSNVFFVVVAVLLAVALLGVSGYFGWDWYQNRTQAQGDRPYKEVSDEQHADFVGVQAAEPIFEALKNGDGDSLLDHWIDGEDLTEHERSLMGTDSYKKVNQRISSYKIRDQVEYVDDDTGRIAVEVVQNGAKKNVSLTLRKVGVEYGFYPVWEVVDAPLVSAMSVVVDQEVPEVLVNSVRVPLTMAEGKARGSIKVLPGHYDVTVPEDVPVQVAVNGGGAAIVGRVYEPKAEAGVLMSLGDKPSVDEVRVEMVPSEYLKNQVQVAVDSYLSYCAGVRTPNNPDCPFAYSGSGVSTKFVRNFSYDIVVPPEIGGVQVLPDIERQYVDVLGSFRWGRVVSSSPGRVRKTWEYNTGTSRKPQWQDRDSLQSFSVNLDIILNGDRIMVVARG